MHIPSLFPPIGCALSADEEVMAHYEAHGRSLGAIALNFLMGWHNARWLAAWRPIFDCPFVREPQLHNRRFITLASILGWQWCQGNSVLVLPPTRFQTLLKVWA
ncbi:hypothetical protein BDW22DRAFT_471470 [Trametopsis cervina]|nr:hypothetical protein BDW22DRAFT_471470 [Trametopsis cervina]